MGNDIENRKIKTLSDRAKICISVKNLWVGIILAVLSFCLCQLAGASTTAKMVLPVMFLVVAFVKIECSDTVAKVLTILWSIVATFVTVFASQLLLNESTFSLGFQRILLNMAICGILIGILYIITASLRISVTVGMTALIIFTSANYFVFKFRGSELCPADFFSFGTAAAVADRYIFSVDAPFAYAVILTMLFLFVIVCISKHKRVSMGKNRLICTVSVLAMVLGLTLGSENIVANHFLQTGSVNNGYFLNFMLEIQENIIQKPEGYNITTIRSLESSYGENVTYSEDSKSPVIITIMNESFADISVLGNKLQTNIDILPFFESLNENTIKGYALSSVFGGGTVNSEYEFLSGNTMGFLPSGSIVYQQFIQENPYTIIPYLKNNGYKTIATHPADEKNWLRYSVYSEMGYDRTYFIDDYPGEDLLRGFVSDQEMYEQIIEWYEAEPADENMFLFCITMQNHGSYYYEKNDYEKNVCLEGYTGNYPDVEQYLTVLHESDTALKYLINYFENVDRDVVILFYGDHFPKLNSSFYEEVHGGTFDSLEEQMLQYTVPFFIWANYDIDEQYVELTSLNYLSNLLLKAAGLELPAYNRFLSDVQDVIPAMNSLCYYSKEQKKFVSYDEAVGIEEDMLQKYQILQYNCMFDNQNGSRFFIFN